MEEIVATINDMRTFRFYLNNEINTQTGSRLASPCTHFISLKQNLAYYMYKQINLTLR